MAMCGLRRPERACLLGRLRSRRAEGFRDYFRHLTEVEPKRAAQFGIEHYSWLCINAKEAENVSLSRDVIQMIPEFLDRPGVLGIGEIGLNKNTGNETTIFQEHVDLRRTNELILIHTPHLEDKYMGTRMIVDMLNDDRRIRRAVLIDHVEEHTVRLALDERLLGGHDALSDDQMHPAAGRGHHRNVRQQNACACNSAANCGETLHQHAHRHVLRILIARPQRIRSNGNSLQQPCHFLAESGKWKIEPGNNPKPTASRGLLNR